LALRIHGTQIFTDNSGEKELHGSQKKKPNNQWRRSQGKAIPKDYFGNKVEESQGEAAKGGDESNYRRQAQRHLGVIRHSQQGNVQQGVVPRGLVAHDNVLVAGDGHYP